MAVNDGSVTFGNFRKRDNDDGGGHNNGGSGSGGGGVEARIARLEAEMTHVNSTMTEVKQEVRDLRGEFGDLRKDVRSDFRWLLGFMVGTGLTLAGMVAKGFGWI